MTLFGFMLVCLFFSVTVNNETALHLIFFSVAGKMQTEKEANEVENIVLSAYEFK